jgi:hypothetical protein
MRVALALLMILALAEPPQKPETVLQRLLRIAGLSAAPSQLRGPGDPTAPGNIWLTNLKNQAKTPLTTEGGYSSPVFAANGAIYALRGSAIVSASGNGPSIEVPGVQKLVGFDETGDHIVVLRSGSQLAVVALKTGEMVPLPFPAQSEEDRKMLAQIKGQERVYGDTAVYTKAETKPGMSRTLEWTDVYLKKGNQEPRNVSACDGDNCTQPALSPDGAAVAYVRSSE